MVDLRKIDPNKANHDCEKSRIRFIKTDDREERKRLWEIEKDQNVAKFVEELSTSEDEMDEFTTLSHNYLVLAVSGKEGHVEEVEVGRLQGWITIYNENKNRLSRLIRTGLVDFVTSGKRILEIGFARHPKAKSGQMASALRQTLLLLHEFHSRDGEGDLIVTAYADESNQASVRVLIAAGFAHKGLVKYRVTNKTFDNLFIWCNA